MELGEKLRTARQEKGLSQRQLCGDTITRNMLSQIENGSAKPSMSTLQILAARLEKPVAYFLDDQAVTSPNEAVMAQARLAPPEAALEILREYREDDPVFDGERWLLETLCCLRLAETALAEGRNAYAVRLLLRAAEAETRTPYATPELTRRRLLLSYEAEPDRAAELASLLPDGTQELLLRGDAALQRGEPQKCLAVLAGAESENPKIALLRGRAYLAAGEWAAGAAQLREAEDVAGSAVYPLLEQCYRELGDFKLAYEYACKQR